MSFGGARTRAVTPQELQGTGISVMTSLTGVPVAVVLGTNRVAGNVIDYVDFNAIPIPQSGGKSGGKGTLTGGGVKGQTSGFEYTVTLDVGIAVGPIQGIGMIWATTSNPETPPDLGPATIFDGAAGQSAWGYMESEHPDRALAYNALAHIAIANMGLGESASLPNLTFEILGRAIAARTAVWDKPPSGSTWNTSYTALSGLAAPFAAIATVVKPPAAAADIVFDTSPAWCLAELLTDTTWGCGLATGLVGDLTAYATWCQAQGIFFSPAITSKRAARDILQDWLKASISDVYWSQGQIKVGIYGDVAVTGTAADGSAITYTPDLTPVMTIDDTLFEPGQGDDGPLARKRKDPAEVNNEVIVEYRERAYYYNTLPARSQDTAHIAQYGERPAPSLQGDFIVTGDVALRVSDLMLAREVGVLATYEWRMSSPGELLEPFDIVAVSDPAMGLVDYPVRVTMVEEEDDTVFHVTAEDIPGLIGNLAERPVAANAATLSAAGAEPGGVNTPIIFEPPSPLTLSGSGLEVWALLSGASLGAWGGATVWASTDGENYGKVGTISGAARMGASTAALASVTAAASGPTYDTVNTLTVNLSESDGELQSTTQAGALALNTLCIVDAELIAYTTATLVAANVYQLTGLVRGVLGSSIAAHNANAPFARLDGAQFRYPFTPDRIGQTIDFKFLSFNTLGANAQTLDEVEPYSYTIQGTALAEDPNNVTGLASAYIAGLAQLIWNPVSDPRDLDYEIRLGTSWAGGQVVGRTALTQSPIVGDGTYWVAAHFKVPNGPDVYSPAPASITVSGTALTSNVIATYDAASDGWSGTKTNTAVAGSALTLAATGNILASSDVTAIPDVRYLGGVVSSGSYEIPVSARVTLSGPATCGVLIKLGATLGYDTNAVDIRNVADITQVTDVLGVDLGNKVTAQPQIRLSQDGVTWGAWQNWVMGSYTAKAFDAQVLLATSDPSVSAVLADFTFSVDVPNRVDQYSGLVTNAGTGEVTQVFQPKGAASPQAFNGGEGPGNTPVANFSIANAQPGDDPPTYTITDSQIVIKTTAGGNPVSRQINNLIVQGY